MDRNKKFLAVIFLVLMLLLVIGCFVALGVIQESPVGEVLTPAIGQEGQPGYEAAVLLTATNKGNAEATGITLTVIGVIAIASIIGIGSFYFVKNRKQNHSRGK